MIELMIVVVIVAILVSVGLPAYQDSVNKGRRSDGQNLLLQLAGLQERFYSDSGFYATLDVISTGTTVASNEGFYNVTVGCPDNAGQCAVGNRPQQYRLTAAPTFTDTLCGNLTYDQTGLRGESGTATVEACW